MRTWGESTIVHDTSVYLKTGSRRQINPYSPYLSMVKYLLTTEEQGECHHVERKNTQSFVPGTHIYFI